MALATDVEVGLGQEGLESTTRMGWNYQLRCDPSPPPPASCAQQALAALVLVLVLVLVLLLLPAFVLPPALGEVLRCGCLRAQWYTSPGQPGFRLEGQMYAAAHLPLP